MISLTLPLPPTINHYYVRSRNNVFLNKKAIDFRKNVCFLAGHFSGYFSSHDRILINIKFFPSNKRKFDLDNRLKGLLDGLQYAGIFPDDEQIDIINVTRGDIIKNGASIITLSNVNDWD